jgi:5-methylcytosine-specific restriction endonuclease McrA
MVGNSSSNSPISLLRTNPVKWRKLRVLVLMRDGHSCYYCGDRATEVDHFISRSDLGTDDLTNLVAACRDCNQRKGAMDGHAFFKLQRLQNAGDGKNSPFIPLTGDYTSEDDR